MASTSRPPWRGGCRLRAHSGHADGHRAAAKAQLCRVDVQPGSEEIVEPAMAVHDDMGPGPEGQGQARRSAADDGGRGSASSAGDGSPPGARTSLTGVGSGPQSSDEPQGGAPANGAGLAPARRGGGGAAVISRGSAECSQRWRCFRPAAAAAGEVGRRCAPGREERRRAVATVRATNAAFSENDAVAAAAAAAEAGCYRRGRSRKLSMSPAMRTRYDLRIKYIIQLYSAVSCASKHVLF